MACTIFLWNISTRCSTKKIQKVHTKHTFHVYIFSCAFSCAFSNELSKVVTYYTGYKKIIFQPHKIILQHHKQQTIPPVWVFICIFKLILKCSYLTHWLQGNSFNCIHSIPHTEHHSIKFIVYNWYEKIICGWANEVQNLKIKYKVHRNTFTICMGFNTHFQKDSQ